jgi:hypothetical protein
MDFEQMLSFLGLDSWEMRSLIEKSSREQWTPSQFAAAVYQSNTFKAAFPGIFRSDGSMIMDPLQYRAVSDQYKQVANRYGVDIDKSRIGNLIHRQVSVSEFQVRSEAIARIEENKVYFDAFNKVAAARGIKGLNTPQEMADFLIGKSDKKFYDLWEEVQIGGAAKMAGVGLNVRNIKQIAKAIPGEEDMDPAALQQHFQNLASSLRTALPQSKIQGYGLTKRDLIELEFGGPRQAAVADKVQRVMAQYEGNMQQNNEIRGNVAARSGGSTLKRETRA